MSPSKVLIVAQYTFKELLKSKILLNVFIIGLGLMVLTYVATEFTYGVPERIALDFGLGMLSLSTLSISLFLGVGLLSKEVDSRTVYMVISRPVSRQAFIFGKLLGLMSIQAINLILLGSMTILSTMLLGGKLNTLIFWCIGFTYLESLMLLLLVVLMSLVANNIISILVSGVLLVLGHSVESTMQTSFVKNTTWLGNVLEAYHFILPGFYKLNLKDFIIYKSSLPLEYLFSSFAYACLYSTFLIGLIIYIFNKKNLD